MLVGHSASRCPWVGMEWDGVRGKEFPLKGVLGKELKLGQELLGLISSVLPCLQLQLWCWSEIVWFLFNVGDAAAASDGDGGDDGRDDGDDGRDDGSDGRDDDDHDVAEDDKDGNDDEGGDVDDDSTCGH